MSVKHKEAQVKRWAKTGAKERKRLGELHRAALKKYWASVPPAERSARARHAANTRHAKPTQ